MNLMNRTIISTVTTVGYRIGLNPKLIEAATRCLSSSAILKRPANIGFESGKLILEKVQEHCHAFIAPVENETLMRNVMKTFVDQLNLSSFTGKRHLSTLDTRSTFMQHFATGKEVGQFLSLLIGESQLEIMMITINNELVKKSDKKVLKLSNFQKYEYTIEMLIALVAEFVVDYVRDDIPYAELVGTIPPLVITYELPRWIDHISLNQGTIVRSTVGEELPMNQRFELRALLMSMMMSWGYNIDVKCIMSFAAACFHDKQWTLRECIASIVLDHSIGICHLEESVQVVGLQEGGVDRSKERILLMTDLAEFGSNRELSSITTEYDVALDTRSSSHPGRKTFRKFISKTYMGELFRLIVVRLIKDGFLLHSDLTYQIKRPFSILSEEVAYFENWMHREKECERILKFKLGYDNHSITDLVILSYVADVVIDRATKIAAMVLAALAERSSQADVGFVFLGSLVSQQRLLRNRLSDYVRFYTRQLNKNIRVVKASSESALRGAALYAARL